MSPPLTEIAGGTLYETPSTCLTVCPILDFPRNPTPPKFQAHASCFQWLFHTNSLSWLMLPILLKSLKQAASGLIMPCTSHKVVPTLALAAADLGSQLGVTWAPPGPAQIAAIGRPFCSSCWMAPGKT